MALFFFPHFVMVFPLLLQFLPASFFLPSRLDPVLYLLLYLSRFRLILEKGGGRPCAWGFFRYLRPYLLIFSSFSYPLIGHMNVSHLCLALPSPQLPPFPLIHLPPSFRWRVAWEKGHWAQSSHLLLTFHWCCKIGGKSSPSKHPWERPGGWRIEGDRNWDNNPSLIQNWVIQIPITHTNWS